MIALDTNILLRLLTHDELIVGFAREESCSALATFDMALKERHPGFVIQPK